VDGIFVAMTRVTFVAVGGLALGKHDTVKSILRRYDPQASTRIVMHNDKHELECMLVWPEYDKTIPFIDEVRKEVQDVELISSEPIVEG
jgi:hypothetical protein